MDVNHSKFHAELKFEENAEHSKEIFGAPIVNLDANFLIPAEEQGKDLVFPRLVQLSEMTKVAEKAGSLVSLDAIPPEKLTSRPYRRPDFQGEWRGLKKAWSLARNGNVKLSKKRVSEASVELYPNDPLKDLHDWVWRFSLFACQPAYEEKFRMIMGAIRPLWGTDRFEAFARHYEADVLPGRSNRYFEIIKDFFSSYSEYGQVYFHVVRGLEIADNYHTASIDFDRTKMFYGNAFEHFASLAELLARFNNMLLGRDHDKFEKLTIDAYLKLDKANRFGPFSMNRAFMEICAETDNQVRNASHHGSIHLDRETQVVRFHSGKGDSGPERQMSYASYLARCCHLLLQTLTLLRMELIFCQQMKLRYPI